MNRLAQSFPKLLSAIGFTTMTLSVTPAFATEKSVNFKSDLKDLIGVKVEGNEYPDGWRGIGSPFFDHKKSLDGETIYRKNNRAFVLRKILVLGAGNTPRRAVVVDAVQIRVNPHKRGDLFISECKHPSIHETETRHIFAEVRFRKCERYSSRISAAWLIDSESQKISPISPKGMRCVDTFFNNGPDGPTCAPIAAEW